MDILVTGGAGFIGSALVKRLVGEGHSVSVIDNLASFDPRFSRPLPPEVEMVVADITHKDAFNRLSKRKFDVIYHLAASFANELSVEYPCVDAESNVLGTVATVEFAKKNGNPMIVYTGSSSSYGVYQGSPFLEDDELRPSTPYALTKKVGEDVLKVLYPGNFVIFRLFNVFGEGDFPGKWRNAIPNMMASAVTNKTVQVYGEDAGRDFTYIRDVVHGLVLPISDDRLVGQVFNLCDGKERKMLDVASTIAARIHGARVVVGPRRAWDKVTTRVGANTKLFDYTGFRPATDMFDEDLEKTLWKLQSVLYTYEDD